MKEIYLAVILSVATLAVVALDESWLEADIPTECPDVDPINTTIHIAHETDCTKYYVCQMGDKIEMKCGFMDKKGNRLHFNPVLQVCDWPDRAGCQNPGSTTTQIPKTKCPRDTKGKSIWLPHEYWCNYFYLCTDGALELIQCPQGLLFNPKNSKCDSPEKVDCSYTSTTNSITTSTPISTRESTTTPITPTTPFTTTEITSTTTEVTPTETTVSTTPKANFCPRNTKGKSIWLPHEYWCNYFYLCTDGALELVRCPQESLFNPKISKCDSPENVDCSYTSTTSSTTISTPISTSKPTTTPITPTTPFTTTEITSTTTEVTSTETTVSTTPKANFCPRDTKGKSIWLPHEYWCDYFYLCTDGALELLRCPQELLFNPKISKCDSPENVDCSYTSTTSSTTVSTPKSTTMPTTAPITTTSAPTTTTTIFTSTSTSIATSTPLPNNLCPPKGSDEKRLLPHECKCDRYYECLDGEMILKMCLKGLHYDYIRQICDLPDRVKCVRPIPPVPESTITFATTIDYNKCSMEKEGRKYQHETNCSAYYECLNGRIILKYCTRGTFFNPNFEKCKHTSCGLINSILFGALMDSDISTIAGNCPPKGSTEKLLLPHKCTCMDYFECINGVRICRRCPSGLHFDYVRQICDMPEVVRCVRPLPMTIAASMKLSMSRTIAVPSVASTSYTCLSTEKRTLPHECECKKYYLCVDGKQVLRTCPAGLRYNHKRAECDKSEIDEYKCI